MSIIVTNEITIPAERAQLVAQKFANNSRSLEAFDGFEGFELCRPTSPADDRWFVITRWRDEECYNTWRESKQFDSSHPQQGPSGEKPKTLKGVDAHSVVRHYSVELSVDGNDQ